MRVVHSRQSTVHVWRLVIVFIFYSSFIIKHSPIQAQPKQPQWQKLYIQPDKRVITRGDGKPFFWLGDTAWELFHRLNKEETDYYLKNRVDKGFTVIQA